ncbi:nuclear transport factor 2 family protein [Brachybacterium sp. GPGPB12]|uniref:nuclear transport factor 2 family protein n=1 Tax=Brachybacterium sp. GPGPB12 TaxID=3023517 RepID=UPI0031343625
MTATTVQDLLDRAGIDDAINAYSHALDQRDWSILPEAFTPDAEIVLIDREKVLDPRSLVESLSRNDVTRLGGRRPRGQDPSPDRRRQRARRHRGAVDDPADHRGGGHLPAHPRHRDLRRRPGTRRGRLADRPSRAGAEVHHP